MHFSLETDVTRLVDEGLVAEDWKDNATKGIATSSVVVFVVRAGNPDGIETWDDLVEPGVEIITPNPGSSGSAPLEHPRGLGARHRRHRRRGRRQGVPDQAARRTRSRCPGSAREATTAFTDGSGDVLLSYENEAILAKQNGADIDYVVPPDTLLIENPAAVTTDASDAGKAFLEYLTSTEAQADYAGVRLPSGRRRRRDRPRSRAPTTRRTRSRLRTRSTPSTTTSAAGARPRTCSSATAKRATPSASSPQLQQELGKEGEE